MPGWCPRWQRHDVWKCLLGDVVQGIRIRRTRPDRQRVEAVFVHDDIVEDLVSFPLLMLLVSGMKIARVDGGQRRKAQLFLPQTLSR